MTVAERGIFTGKTGVIPRFSRALFRCLSLLVFGVCSGGFSFVATGYAADDLPAHRPDEPFFLLPDIQKIKTRGSLVVAQKAGENPPFFFFERTKTQGVTEAMRFASGGETVAGTDIEIAKMLAETLGVALDLRRGYTSSQAVVDAVAAGEADMGASGLRVTFDGLQKVRFSEAYAIFSYALLVNRHAPLPGGFEPTEKSGTDDFDRAFNRPDCKIGVENRSAAAEQLPLLFPRATAIHYAPGENPSELLLSHKVDAVLDDDFTFLFSMILRPEQNLYFRILKIPDSQERIALAVNPHLPTLASLADEAARAMRSDSTKELFKEYGTLIHSFAAETSPRQTRIPKHQTTTENAAHPPRDGQALPPSGISPAALGALGIPLLGFLTAWLAMAGRRNHGTRKN